MDMFKISNETQCDQTASQRVETYSRYLRDALTIYTPINIYSGIVVPFNNLYSYFLYQEDEGWRPGKK